MTDDCWKSPPHTWPTAQDYVEHFYELLGDKPEPTMALRLVLEEFTEFWNEVEEEHRDYEPEDSEKTLKELADLVYVIYGYALSRGWDLDHALFRVHTNNIGRMTQPDGTIKRREDGKVIKNPDYAKVNLEDLV